MEIRDCEKYMQRCLQIAKNGEQTAPPNPLVGSVVVYENCIIGEGFHQQYGSCHAEVNAINNVRDKKKLQESTLFVNLEPCFHYGKTPPCCDLILEKKIPRVIIGMQDPFSKVGGRSIEKLRNAGVEVVVGVCEEACRELNKAFITYHSLKRPYVTLKWAESADGYLDYVRSAGTPLQLSSLHSLLYVHHLRAIHDAILVGRRTAELDNPRLDVRHWQGKSPLRIVVGDLAYQEKMHLFEGEQETLIYQSSKNGTRGKATYVSLADVSLPNILNDLYQRGVHRLMVEGGGKILQSFFDANLWDEALVERCKVIVGKGVKAPQIPSGVVVENRQLLGSCYTHYKNKNRCEDSN